jgi:hypothetical protein
MHVIEIAFSKGCHKLQLETNYKFAQGAFRERIIVVPTFWKKVC